MRSQSFLPFLSFLALVGHSTAIYVSYENVKTYKEGQSLPILANTLRSPSTLGRLDAEKLSWCETTLTSVESNRHWQKSIDTLYGNDWHEGPTFNLAVGENKYCQRVCVADVNDWKQAIRQNMHHQWYIDNLPLVYLQENPSVIVQNYWQGLPVGQVTGSSQLQEGRYAEYSLGDLMVNNHFRFTIEYKSVKGGYQVIRTTVQPMSIRRIDETEDPTVSTSRPSCRTDRPMSYNEYVNIPPQRVDSLVWFSYDVQWKQAEDNDRWQHFLEMNGYIRLIDQFAALFLGVLINGIVIGVVWTWVNRDLSYKPLIGETEEITDEAAQEIELWPLSTRVFFPPSVGSQTLCILCGIGSQLFVTASTFVFFFQFGILNQSLGSTIITAFVVIYMISSVMGGYVTGRFCKILHVDHEKTTYACMGTALLLPVIGIIVCYLSYDAFLPDYSPYYGVVGALLIFILLLVLIILPVTIFFGTLGYRHGPLDGFPVSEGVSGYQDLNLQSDTDTKDAEQTKRWKRMRVLLVLLFGGILPTLTCFIPFSYGIAGPIIVGFYSSPELWSLIFFIVFVVCVGSVAILLFYRQIRINNFQWWWSTFLAGASAGFYIYILTWSWLFFNLKAGRLHGGTFASYFIWFTFLSIVIAFMSGSIGIFSCIWFCRRLYSVTLSRAQMMVPSEWTSSPVWRDDNDSDGGIQQVQL